jgi:hypothetical protein
MQFLGHYIGSKTDVRMPWKEWLKWAAEHCLCILNWPNNMPIPGRRDFNIHKLNTASLKSLAEPLIELHDDPDAEVDAICIRPWTEGTRHALCHYLVVWPLIRRIVLCTHNGTIFLFFSLLIISLLF